MPLVKGKRYPYTQKGINSAMKAMKTAGSKMMKTKKSKLQSMMKKMS